MYLLVNCDTKEVFQQTFEPTQSQIAKSNLLFFQSKQQTYNGGIETLFDISSNCLTGWEEIPVLDVFLEDCEKVFPKLLDREKLKVGLLEAEKELMLFMKYVDEVMKDWPEWKKNPKNLICSPTREVPREPVN